MRHLFSTILATLFSFQLLTGSLHAVRAADVSVTADVKRVLVAYFVIIAPQWAMAGQPFTVTVIAKDKDGQTTVNIPEDVIVSTPNGGVISPIRLLMSEFTDDGSWTGEMILTEAGLARIIRVQSGTASGEATVDIYPPPQEPLSPLPPTPPPGLKEEIGKIIDRFARTLDEIRESLRANPIARIVTRTIAPVLTPMATITAAITALTQIATAAPLLVSIGDAFLYISYLWTVLLEFSGLKRRRRSWGVVFNAASKEPLPLVVVELIDVQNGKVIERRITDFYGRFGFLVKIGRYKLNPIHPRYSFPSLISPHQGDLRYADLYHGEEIEIADPDTLLAVNIPLDPKEKQEVAKPRLTIQLSFRRVSLTLLLLSVFVQALTVYLYPTSANLSLFAGYLLVLIVLAFLMSRRQRAWGVVYDADTKRELALAQIYITSEDDPRFVARRAADIFGRFYLLLPQGTYRLTVSRPDYQFPGPPESLGYKGEALSISAKNPLVYVDVPMGRVEQKE